MQWGEEMTGGRLRFRSMSYKICNYREEASLYASSTKQNLDCWFYGGYKGKNGCNFFCFARSLGCIS